MFHVKLLVLYFFLLLQNSDVLSQGKYYVAKVDKQIELPVDKNLVSLSNRRTVGWSAKEIQVLYAINFVRSNPKRFLDSAIKPYLKLHPHLAGSYSQSLEQTLNAMNPVNIVIAGDTLRRLAQVHAKDLAKSKTFSHESSNGKSMFDRFDAFGVGCGSENINGGYENNGLEVVISLLLDINVPNLGHRKSILNPKQKLIGVSEEKQDKGWNISVITFGCD